MSTQNPFDGSVYLTPDHAVGYGTAISSPASLLSSMITQQFYYREVGQDVDVILLNVEGALISLYKSFTNQKLLQMFVARQTSVNGQAKIRWIHRSLATTFTFEQALRAVGEDITVSDDWSSANLASINQQLAPKYIQVFLAP